MIRSSAVAEGTLRELGLIVNAAHSPQDGWKGIIEWVSARSNLDSKEVSTIDIDEESEKLTKQLGAAISKHPIPEEIRFLYFGLYESNRNTCGFYLSGGARAPENPNDLTDNSLTNAARVYLRSGLLDELLRKSKELPELDSWFGYALSWGAAAILAKYSSRALGLSQELLVGFDSGDVERIK